MDMKKILKGLGSAALTGALTYVSPASWANVAGGSVLKHIVPDDVFQNKHIPLASIGVTALYHYETHAVTTGDWLGGIGAAVVAGTQQGGIGWALHQSIKVPTQGVLAVNGKSL
jgi:hypothetical protein